MKSCNVYQYILFRELSFIWSMWQKNRLFVSFSPSCCQRNVVYLYANRSWVHSFLREVPIVAPNVIINSRHACLAHKYSPLQRSLYFFVPGWSLCDRFQKAISAHTRPVSLDGSLNPNQRCKRRFYILTNKDAQERVGKYRSLNRCFDRCRTDENKTMTCQTRIAT